MAGGTFTWSGGLPTVQVAQSHAPSYHFVENFHCLVTERYVLRKTTICVKQTYERSVY